MTLPVRRAIIRPNFASIADTLRGGGLRTKDDGCTKIYRMIEDRYICGPGGLIYIPMKQGKVAVIAHSILSRRAATGRHM